MHLLRLLQSEGYRVVLLTPHDEYTERLRAAGFDWHEFAMDRRSVNPFAQVVDLFRLWRIFVHLSPQVTHCFTIKCVVLGGIAGRLARVRQRVHAIAGLGSIFTDDQHKTLRFAVTRALRVAVGGHSSAVIVQNPDDARLLADLNIVPLKRIVLIRGSGVDGERFQADRTEETRSVVRFLFAARLLWAKGIRDFVWLAENTHLPNVEFVVAGQPDPGNPDSVDEAFLARCEQVDNLTMLGHVDDMAALLRSVSVVVLPSSYGEGVPRSLVESAAAGLPLIAYDVPGSREIVIDSHNGMLCEPDDRKALLAAVQQLATDALMREQYGACSRRHFESEYDQATVNKQTLAVYRNLDDPAGILRGGADGRSVGV